MSTKATKATRTTKATVKSASSTRRAVSPKPVCVSWAYRSR
jgi:hypothetical protein